MYENELSAAIRAVRLAAGLCREVQHRLVDEQTFTKKDKSPVTVADFGSQALIIATLKEAFSSDPIVAEEDAHSLRQEEQAGLKEQVFRFVRNGGLPEAGDADILDTIDGGQHGGGPEDRFWTLDPIDGTKGFIRGDQYAIALALIEQGRVVLGVLACPNLSPTRLDAPGGAGTLFYARTGAGAGSMPLDEDRDGTKTDSIRVSPTSVPSEMVFCESVESGHSAHGHSAEVARRLSVTTAPVRLDSQGKYAVVARGEASAYLRLPTRPDYREKIWDHAAGALIVEEAGGRVTDVGGKPLDFSQGRTLSENQGVIATNGSLHEKVTRAVGEVLGI